MDVHSDTRNISQIPIAMEDNFAFISCSQSTYTSVSSPPTPSLTDDALPTDFDSDLATPLCSDDTILCLTDDEDDIAEVEALIGIPTTSIQLKATFATATAAAHSTQNPCAQNTRSFLESTVNLEFPSNPQNKPNLSAYMDHSNVGSPRRDPPSLPRGPAGLGNRSPLDGSRLALQQLGILYNPKHPLPTGVENNNLALTCGTSSSRTLTLSPRNGSNSARTPRSPQALRDVPSGVPCLSPLLLARSSSCYEQKITDRSVTSCASESSLVTCSQHSDADATVDSAGDRQSWRLPGICQNNFHPSPATTLVANGYQRTCKPVAPEEEGDNGAIAPISGSHNNESSANCQPSLLPICRYDVATLFSAGTLGAPFAQTTQASPRAAFMQASTITSNITAQDALSNRKEHASSRATARLPLPGENLPGTLSLAPRTPTGSLPGTPRFSKKLPIHSSLEGERQIVRTETNVQVQTEATCGSSSPSSKLLSSKLATHMDGTPHAASSNLASAHELIIRDTDQFSHGSPTEQKLASSRSLPTASDHMSDSSDAGTFGSPPVRITQEPQPIRTAAADANISEHIVHLDAIHKSKKRRRGGATETKAKKARTKGDQSGRLRDPHRATGLLCPAKAGKAVQRADLTKNPFERRRKNALAAQQIDRVPSARSKTLKPLSARTEEEEESSSDKARLARKEEEEDGSSDEILLARKEEEEASSSDGEALDSKVRRSRPSIRAVQAYRTQDAGGKRGEEEGSWLRNGSEQPPPQHIARNSPFRTRSTSPSVLEVMVAAASPKPVIKRLSFDDASQVQRFAHLENSQVDRSTEACSTSIQTTRSSVDRCGAGSQLRSETLSEVRLLLHELLKPPAQKNGPTVAFEVDITDLTPTGTQAASQRK
ncbi:hypothetical protein NM688_g480 [Phlebia brevispora]|uniref:Uncharacterized protein n=1 Tax=Phlebia brevispora TaxID=194682 RepID=A0ACC1TE25_9APHY|nr:hypothetical protein NM688_g480 [Phlebia brevispora]